jgi:AraC-like DNA-binding protein
MSVNLKEGEYYGKNVLTQENAFFKLSLHNYDPKFEIAEHYHENDYISVLTRGNYIEKNQNQESFIETGAILFRPKEYNHCNTFAYNGGSCFNVEFKKNWNQYLDVNFKLPTHFKNYKTGSFASLYKLVYHFLNDKTEGDNTELIYDWLFQINQSKSIPERLPWIKKVKTILENELSVFHSLTSLSENVFVNQIYLSGAFRKRTGFTISEYQLKMKLENAMRLLLTSSLSVTEISFQNGFFDDAHFINAFKNNYGVSPFKFRQVLK